MTAFIAEGKRLGIDAPYLSGSITRPKDAEGLCITDCGPCRKFRNEVREALAAEQAEEESLLALRARVWQDWFRAGREQGIIDALDAINAL